MSLIQRMESGENKLITKNRNCPKPLVDPAMSLSQFVLTDIPELEIARQLTILDFEQFRGIEPRECLNQVRRRLTSLG